MNSLPSDLFARRLRAERERAELSQAALARLMAERLGSKIDPSAVTRIEQQTRAVRLDEAVAVAEALDLPLVMLLSEDPAGENERRVRQYLGELAAAESQWARTGAEIDRLTTAVKELTEERARLAGARPETPALDPELAAAIDARIPVEDIEEDEPPTAPDA